MKRLIGLILLVSLFSIATLAYEDLRYGVAVYGQNPFGTEAEKAAYRELAESIYDFVDWEFVNIDIIDGKTIPNDALMGYKVLIIPSLEGIDQAFVDELRDFTLDGGKLIVSVNKTEGAPKELYDLLGVSPIKQKGTLARFVADNGIMDNNYTIMINSSLALEAKENTKTMAKFDSGADAVVLSDVGLAIAGDIFAAIDDDEDLQNVIIESIYHLGDTRILTGFAPLSISDWEPLFRETRLLVRQARSNIRSNENQFRPPTPEIQALYDKASAAGELMEYAYGSENAMRVSPYYRVAEQLAKEVIALNQPVRNFEARAVWMDEITIAQAGNPRQLRAVVRKFADAGFNMILPEVVYQGAAIFENPFGIQEAKYHSWDEDPLTVIVDEAHKHGMEVHVWTWVFCAGYGHKFGPLLELHPEWAEEDEAGRVFSNWQYGTAWLNASMPEVRDYLNDLFTYIVSEYGVDGLHLDYIRYNEDDIGHFGLSDFSRNVFKNEHGFDPKSVRVGSADWKLFNQWRENNVTSFVKEMSEKVKKINPDLKISAAVGPNPDYARDHILQNWKNWADNGILDFIITMAYTDNNSTLRTNTNRGLEVTENSVYVYPGLGVYVNTTQNNVTQTQLTRSLGTTGVAMFSTIHLLNAPEKIEDLKNGAFREPAVIPHAEPVLALKGLLEEAAFVHVSAEKEDKAQELLELKNTIPDETDDLLSLMERISGEIGRYLNDLEEQKNKRELSANEFEALSGALLSAWRITQINIYQNTERPWIEAIPR